MKFSRFRYLLDAYGAALERWPEPEQEPAKKLLEVSPEARDAYAEAVSLDAVLATDEIAIDAAAVTRMREAVRIRVAQTPPEEPRISALRGFFNLPIAVPYARIGALALAASVSMWIGWSSAYAAHPDLLSA